MSTSDPYYELPKVGPYEVRIGSGLITMVEPHIGHEHAYNRWYEDDHYYAGCLAMPWMFAGRRWVAPVDLQKLRYPADSAVAQPIDAGSTSLPTGSPTVATRTTCGGRCRPISASSPMGGCSRSAPTCSRRSRSTGGRGTATHRGRAISTLSTTPTGVWSSR